jgi:hypothetical protein
MRLNCPATLNVCVTFVAGGRIAEVGAPDLQQTCLKMPGSSESSSISLDNICSGGT